MRKLGLNGYPEKVKCSGLKWKIKTLFWEIRYAWQRAWRGYDFTDVFELGYNFTYKMPVLLREFKEHNDALFTNIDGDGVSPLTKEETDAILDEMIFYFDNCDEDHVYKRLFGHNPWEEEYNHERHREAGKEYVRCWNEAMRLFAKWSMHLWY